MTNQGVLEVQYKTQSLSKIAPGSMFEIKAWRLVDMVYGKGIILSIIEKKVTTTEIKCNASEIIVSDRFEPECEKVPCMGYYAGQKLTKNSTHHDLHFIKHDNDSGISWLLNNFLVL